MTLTMLCEKKGTSLGEFQGTRRERKREEVLSYINLIINAQKKLQ
jgi:hypothetical protein